MNSQKRKFLYEKISFLESTNFFMDFINLLEKPHKTFLVNLHFPRISISRRKSNFIEFPLFREDHRKLSFERGNKGRKLYE